MRVTFLDDDDGQDGEVAVDDAAPHGLASSLAGPPLAETRVTPGQQESHSASGQHSLLHGKSLLVIASSDTQHVTLKCTMSSSQNNIQYIALKRTMSSS